MTPDLLRRSPRAIDALFERNGWPVGFRNGIYPFTHYHSVTHEALGIASGSAQVQFGGEAGPVVKVWPGDVVVLPAGTGHKRIEASADLLVIGAYPPGAEYDLIRSGSGEGDAVRARILRVAKPASDPVEGPGGALARLWRER